MLWGFGDLGKGWDIVTLDVLEGLGKVEVRDDVVDNVGTEA